MNLLLTRVEVDGRVVDVRIRGENIAAVDNGLRPQPAEDVIDGGGGGLLPGLHDHHLHLLATAAAMVSVRCGPPDVRGLDALAAALRTAAMHAPANAWIRGVGYLDSVEGSLDRHVLDRLVPDHPVRVQHRSGALWVLNSAALHAADLDEVTDADAERDAAGELTGRLWRYDARLRQRLPGREPPDLAAVTRQLAAYGITGVTDATPDLDASTLTLLADAVSAGSVRQRLMLLGAPDECTLPPGIEAGPRKLLLPDHDLPAYDDVLGVIENAHGAGRAVAVHCVTRESLLLTLLALEEAGPLAGDRIEHAAVVPPGVAERIAALRLAVVTQPSFLVERGDDYLRDVEPDDVPHLYPYASLLSAGITVAPSSDAPYGPADPWRAIAAARDRTTRAGGTVSVQERVDARTALAGYLSPPRRPGGPPRHVRPGVVADLCLLDAPLREVLAEPCAERVRLVLLGGEAHPGV